MRSVYLAGPDVFYPDCREIFAARTKVCTALGLKALIPVDDQMTTARAIYENNVVLIERSNGVIANVTPFRGPHCDVGTAWEMGYAVAKGKPIFAFSDDSRTLIERIPNVSANGRDKDGNLAEDFGLPENLMIAESVVDRKIHASFRQAAMAAAEYFQLSIGRPQHARA